MNSIVETERELETVNGLFRNKVRVIQAAKGYRVSEDAIILTWFTRLPSGGFVLDAGTGCGAISFGLALKAPSTKIVGLEIQAGLADRASRGIRLNNLESRVWIVRGDFRHADRFFRERSFDLIVSNPPYHEAGRGRISSLREKALSRHQMMLPLEDLFSVSAKLLKPAGRLSFIYPHSGLDRIKKAMKETGFQAARMLLVHSYEGSEPGLVCLEVRMQANPSAVVTDALFLYHRPGIRTKEAEAILAGEDIHLGDNAK